MVEVMVIVWSYWDSRQMTVNSVDWLATEDDIIKMYKY
jgi:hypothetical protein